MNKIKLLICLLSGWMVISACEKKVEIPGGADSKYSMVYLPAAARSTNPVLLKMNDSVQVISIGATWGGIGAAGKNIDVKLDVLPGAVTEFNSAHGTTYPLLPADSYEFNSNAVIAQGKISSELLQIKINPANKLELFKEYLLPVTITKVTDGIALNENLKTAYYIVKASLSFSDFTIMDRAKWTVADFDSQEPAEGPVNGGTAVSVLDNLSTTFWHTKWNGGESPFPHWLTIDMGASHTLHGISYLGRQSDNRGKPRDMRVSVSNNGTDWEDVGIIQGQDTNDLQRYFVTTFRPARYFKITFISAYGDTRYTHLAELWAF
jgi:hypothetical protein